MHDTKREYPKLLKIWLIIGLLMIFGQVVIGGITRLTGSGLSITKWEIVTGSLPPMGERAWNEAFDLYKATPQYQKINAGMSLAEFKFIYFWEYFHRLWARLMGFVFAIPFFIFWRKGWIDRVLMRRLAIVIGLAALAASFGWIMVASGLVNRPWVNAYKLTLHLSIGLSLYGYLFWTTLGVFYPDRGMVRHNNVNKWAKIMTVVLGVQIVLGGIMSGMKAGLFYPTWPDMNGELIPALLFQSTQWNVDNFVHYDSAPFMSALIQVLHRLTAYGLTIIVLAYFFKARKLAAPPVFHTWLYLLITLLVVQVTLGILTVVSCVGLVPVGLGVLHQAGALLLLTAALFQNYAVLEK
ncbi:MAG: COX15/CtaA family protein [Saprospiraceae bacterium]|nr:COX15/CtaA family protein [Saprospiraceae bacterium]